MICDVVCVWWNSQSIKDNPENPYYKACLLECDGKNTKCLVYTPVDRTKYFRNKLYQFKEVVYEKSKK
jgi:hypothetical protein